MDRILSLVMAGALVCSAGCSNSGGDNSTPPPSGGVSIAISPTSASLSTGSQQQFTATVSGTTNTGVNWSVTSGSGTIDSSGLFTAPNTQEADTVQVQSQADSTKTASATVTVSTATISISVSPGSATVNEGAQKQFTATVSGTANTGVNWSVTKGTGTINSSGLFTAPNTKESDTVQTQSQADTTKTASANVTVPAVGISISPTSVVVAPNATQQFTATVTGTTNQSVSWSDQGNGSVSGSGLYTAPATNESDSVTVTSVADPTKSATAAVTVGSAQGACGNTLNWTNSTCQQTASGPLNTAVVNGANDPAAWTVISRHGEYAQNETECNIPGAISTGANGLVINTSASPYTCGDFDPTTGTPCSSVASSPCPASYPYSTGDVQWNTFNLKFGTIVFQATYPAASTSLWPSHWLLTTQCQNSNKYTGDTGLNGCPNFGANGYDEVDIIECYGGSCRMNVYHNGQTNDCFFSGSNWDTNPHTWMWTWTSSAITLSRDGTQICNITSGIPQSNLFMLIQTQTGGVGGTPVNADLPATLTTKFVKVCNTTDGSCASVANNDSSVTFYDGFQ